MNVQSYKVLSIDAWGNADDGYDWNQWFHAGNIQIDINSSNDAVLAAMEEKGFVGCAAGGDVEDDGYNLVIVDKTTREPIFAIEYGSQH